MEQNSSEYGSAAQQNPGADRSAWAKSFVEFWPLYLSQHANPKTRWFHYLGTLAGMGAGLIVLGRSSAGSSLVESLIVAAFTQLIVSHVILFVSHWVVEGNQPTSLQAVGKEKGQIARELWWSIRGDFKMLSMALRETLPAELAKYDVK